MYKSPKPEIAIEEDVTSDVKEPKIKFDKFVPQQTSNFCGQRGCGHKLKVTKTLFNDMDLEGTCPKCGQVWDLTKSMEVIDKTE